MKVQRPVLKKARIEIIPMIDAIFFLLVFFMFSSLSMVKFRGVTLGLPTNASASTKALSNRAQPAGEPSKLVVTVTDAGQYYINRSPVSAATLQAQLQGEVNAKRDAVIIVNVARSQTTQSLISVMDAVQRVSTPDNSPLRVLIATEPTDLDGFALKTPAKPAS